MLCALLLLLCPAAQGQGKREQGRIAKLQNALGLKLYQSGDYQGAVNAFWAAYQIRQAPQLLFNIAQAHRRSGHLEQARDLYQRFLADAGESPLRVEAETHLGEVRAELSRRAAAEQLAKDEAAARDEAAAKETAKARIVAQEPTRPAPPPPTPFYKKGWFYGVLGGVAAATALGVGLGVGLRPGDPHTDLGFHPVVF